MPQIPDFITLWPTAVTVLAVVFVSAAIASRVSRLIVRRVIKTLATRSTGGGQPNGFWRVRAIRIGGENGDVREQRRRQRIDAASRMVNHLVTVMIWIVATIVVFHLLEINPAFFLSSAGFLGAGLAIGGQHKVNDYLTGLSVHFEDRYGVGDDIVVDVGWAAPVRAIVDHVGLFSTRLHDGHSTFHFPNGQMANVENRSQEAAVSTLRLQVPGGATAAEAGSVLRGLAGSDGLTDVVFLGDLATYQEETGAVEVEVRTARNLDGRVRERLIDRAEQKLGER